MWNLHGIGEESLFKWSRSFVVLHYCQPPRGAGAFSRDFTINLSPQCRAFSRALETEKLAPLFLGPVGAGTTNGWCITLQICYGPIFYMSNSGQHCHGPNLLWVEMSINQH